MLLADAGVRALLEEIAVTRGSAPHARAPPFRGPIKLPANTAP
jgi:hypothetical protein